MERFKEKVCARVRRVQNPWCVMVIVFILILFVFLLYTVNIILCLLQEPSNMQKQFFIELNSTLNRVNMLEVGVELPQNFNAVSRNKSTRIDFPNGADLNLSAGGASIRTGADVENAENISWSIFAGIVTIGTVLRAWLRLASSERGFTLPGHNFLGPGNPTDTALPVDTDDIIARAHDIAYGSATHSEDIVAADHHAISDFNTDWEETGNVHSLGARLGLQLKSGVEAYTGVLYPRISRIPLTTTRPDKSFS